MKHLPRFTLPQLNRSRIARIISSRQSIAIASIAVLIISAWLITSCIQNDDSVRYLKVAGSCNQQTSIALVDESIDSNMYIQLQPEKRRLFKKYARDVSKYLFAKIDAMGQCEGRWMNAPDVKLNFVYRPVVGKIKFDFLPNFNDDKSSDTEILDSPWVKMRIDKSNKLVVRAVFFWNERQFLFDQVVLFNKSVTSTSSLVPLEAIIYQRYLEDYENTVEITPRKIFDSPPPEKVTEHFQQQIIQKYEKSKFDALANISKRIAPDVLWLFKHSYTTANGIEDPSLTMHRILNLKLKEYTNLTKILLNNCLFFEKRIHSYRSILDLKNLFDTEKYRID